MDDNTLIQHFQPLYDDLRKEDEFFNKKPLLTHYTSIHVLEKILETEELWFSNPLYMNDLEEVRFGISQSVSLVLDNDEIAKACKTSERADILRKNFEIYYNKYASDNVFDTYVFCLSEHSATDNDGLLSMWRGYGENGKGAAIVFDTSQINPVPDSPFIIGKVKYASKEERIEWLKNKLTQFSRLLGNSETANDKLNLPVFLLFQRIILFALFTKHNGFREEHEWRVVYLKDRDKDNRFEPMFSYWVGPRGIEPLLKFKIAPIGGLTGDLSLSKIINRIIIGPSISSPMTQSTVLRMLDRLKKPGLKEKVHSSRIPFRPT